MLPISKPGNQSRPGRPSELWEDWMGAPPTGNPSYPTSVHPDWVLLSTCRSNPDSPQRFPKGWFPSPRGPLRKKKCLQSLACGRPPSLPVGLQLTTEPLTCTTSRDQSGEVRGLLREDLGPKTVHRATEQARGSGRITLRLAALRLGHSLCPYQRWRLSRFRRLCCRFLRAAPVQSAVDNCLGRRAGDGTSQ